MKVSDCCGAEYTTGEGWITGLFGRQRIGTIHVCKKCNCRCTPIEKEDGDESIPHEG
jgi:hypothetical protein